MELNNFIKELSETINENDVSNAITHIKSNGITAREIKEIHTFEEFVRDKNFLVIIFVLMIKKVTWQRELINEYGILSTRKLKKYLTFMLDSNLIYNCQFHDLDQISQEVLMKTMSGFTNWLNSSPILFILTPKGEEWLNHMQEDIKNILFKEGNEHIFDSVMKKTKAVNQLFFVLNEREKEKLERLVRSPYEEVYYCRRTKADLTFEKEIKESLAEIKGKQLIDSSKTNALMLNKKIILGEFKAKTTYNGKLVSSAPLSYISTKDYDEHEKNEIEREVKERQELIASSKTQKTTLKESLCVGDDLENLNFLNHLIGEAEK